MARQREARACELTQQTAAPTPARTEPSAGRPWLQPLAEEQGRWDCRSPAGRDDDRPALLQLPTSPTSPLTRHLPTPDSRPQGCSLPPPGTKRRKFKAEISPGTLTAEDGQMLYPQSTILPRTAPPHGISGS